MNEKNPKEVLKVLKCTWRDDQSDREYDVERRFSIRVNQPMTEKLAYLRFEVFGKVQGVFFRKYTEKEAKKLRLVGWVENTDRNTVIGEAEGSLPAIESFKHFLSKVGSPSCRIDKAEFFDEKVVEKPSFSTFGIKR